MTIEMKIVEFLLARADEVEADQAPLAQAIRKMVHEYPPEVDHIENHFTRQPIRVYTHIPRALTVLAGAFSDHPDYQSDWTR